jgi:hypothetical protein
MNFKNPLVECYGQGFVDDLARWYGEVGKDRILKLSNSYNCANENRDTVIYEA